MSKVSIMIPLNYREWEATPDQHERKEERKVESSLLGTVQAPWARVAKEHLLGEGHLHLLPKQPPLRLLSLATGKNLSHSSALLNTVVQKFFVF